MVLCYFLVRVGILVRLNQLPHCVCVHVFRPNGAPACQTSPPSETRDLPRPCLLYTSPSPRD